ncbi:MAG: putative sulfate exporter family transporter [Actinomycetota bacterium]|nr:putative sulfate exporter family transporter [Actinomycetota bacterium]
MPPDLVTGLGILLLAGFIGGRISRKFKIPAVTGYIIVGILLGPSVTNIITTHLNESLEFVKVLGLGLIALVIGGELHFKGLRELGKSVLVITIVQVFGAFVVVFFVTRFILGIPLPICLLLGAMASATAPASPVAVIREYKARGPLTNTLLAVVGLDDAACILLFPW